MADNIESSELLPLNSKKNLQGKSFKQYERYLNSVIENPDIQNIAITGKYGSGKSSIVDSYFENRQKADFLKVSFASFKDKNKSKQSENKNNDNNPDNKNKSKTNRTFIIKNKNNSDYNSSRKIEQSIINQILYQINPSKIPLTNFKVKQPLSKTKKVLYSLEIIFLIIIFFPSHPNILTNFLQGFLRLAELFLSSESYVYWSINILITLLIQYKVAILLPFISWNIWSFLSHFQIKQFKISFKSVGAEIDLPNDDLFEKYIDEIVYIFKQSEKKILILEDIDRFDELDIFEKLRELNVKLNSSSNMPTKWQFIYLVKDDIFNNAESRVKFFDIIIPVIPFITTNNSYSKLNELFSNEKIKQRLIDIFSNYIDDYRLLVNIRNEYQVFKAHLDSSDLNQLLALIGYKNKYPKKFDDLQNGKGSLNELINKFSAINYQKKNNLQNEVQNLIKRHKENIAESEDEILVLDFMRTSQLSSINNLDDYKLGRPYYSIEFLPYELGKSKKQTYEEYSQTEYFKDRVQLATSPDYFDERLNDLQNQITNIDEKKLKDIERSDLEESNIEIDDLMFALIVNGFVDEHYLDVINKYYGDVNNHQFKKSLISQQENFDFQLKLTDVSHLVKDLNYSDHHKKQILNFTLFNFYLKSGNEEKASLMIDTAQRNPNFFLEKYLTYYPKDINNIVSLNNKLHFDISKITQENVFKEIIFGNFYNCNDLNMEYIVLYLQKNNIFEKYSQPIISGDVYTELKEIIIQNLPKKYNVEEIVDNVDNDLISVYFDNNKIYPTIDAILEYVKQQEHDGEYFVFNETINNFCKNNIDELTQSDEIIPEKLFDSVLCSKTMDNKIKEKFFSKYGSANYQHYTSVWLDKIEPKDFFMLLNFKLVVLDEKIFLFLLQNNKDVLEYFETQVVIEALLSHDFESSVISTDTLLSLIQEKTADTFLILAKNLSLFNGSTDKIKQLLLSFPGNQFNKDNYKFVNILKKDKRSLTSKFTNNEANEHILNYLKENNFIRNFALANNKYYIE